MLLCFKHSIRWLALGFMALSSCKKASGLNEKDVFKIISLDRSMEKAAQKARESEIVKVVRNRLGAHSSDIKQITGFVEGANGVLNKLDNTVDRLQSSIDTVKPQIEKLSEVLNDKNVTNWQDVLANLEKLLNGDEYTKLKELLGNLSGLNARVIRNIFDVLEKIKGMDPDHIVQLANNLQKFDDNIKTIADFNQHAENLSGHIKEIQNLSNQVVDNMKKALDENGVKKAVDSFKTGIENHHAVLIQSVTDLNNQVSKFQSEVSTFKRVGDSNVVNKLITNVTDANKKGDELKTLIDDLKAQIIQLKANLNNLNPRQYKTN